ncbi:uncharacterized protein LOC122640005 isoform X1 [Telopea speciosissima]|uniref:uncharacterized protein LOC122640005 isoform X1 n=1 Tax=Telopea speciosissima TaxID=54955 RepID=UPI001CC4C1C7|nr:uncharacterized protein LOC122640005 isoform X1 [Telopea speciosissima]
MGEEELNLPPSPRRPSPSSRPTTDGEDAPPPPPQPSVRFDPSRMIGIIKRKALIKDLAAVYHAECLSYCQQLLELQKKREEVRHILDSVCVHRHGNSISSRCDDGIDCLRKTLMYFLC